LNVDRAECDAKYLGLPMPEGCLTSAVFKSIEERCVKIISDWRERTLSQVAKEMLINSVAQALPAYMMSVFKILFGMCDALEKHTRAFWWGAANGKRKMQWIPWDVLVKPKSYGGMGFRDMRLFNQALLAHQAMQLISYLNSLCAQVLKAKYFTEGNVLNMALASDASPTWRAIEYGVELLKHGVINRIGDGQGTRIWRDNWIPRRPNLKPSGAIHTCRLRRVSQLMRLGSNEWDEGTLRRYFILGMLVKS
jgi:hypothetical protein